MDHADSLRGRLLYAIPQRLLRAVPVESLLQDLLYHVVDLHHCNHAMGLPADTRKGNLMEDGRSSHGRMSSSIPLHNDDLREILEL